MSKTLCDLVAEFADKPPGKVRGIVIHLRRATERRALVETLVCAVGSLDVWDAADGVALVAGGHPIECGIDPGVVRTAGEVGCVTSHMLAYEKALRDGISHLVVFEDDCCTGPGFSLDAVGKYLREVKDISREFGMERMTELVLLGTCGCYRWKDIRIGVKATDHFNGSHAYIIAAPMMRRMLDCHLEFLARKKTAPIDGLLPYVLQSERAHAFCAEDDIAFFRQNRAIPSYIVSDGSQQRTD